MNSPERDGAALLIGTFREVTKNQVRYMKDMDFVFRRPSVHPRNMLDLYLFRLGRDHRLLDDKFIDHLSGYATLIISGGATADFILKRSGFMYIENHESIIPLVSTGTVRGGKFEGVRIVLKGGLIGSESCYADILKHIGVLSE